MKRQIAIRTYPEKNLRIQLDHEKGDGLRELKKRLCEGYNVVYVNPFDISDGTHGNEYILEKETKDEE